MGREKRRILVVEDDPMIAMDLEHIVADFGCVPVGPASNVAKGLAIVRQTRLDGAVLDINLGGERVWPLAELLDDQRVPFVLATGYSASEIPPRFQDRLILEKPLTEGALAAAFRTLGLVEACS